jgi:hypothetical protein
VIATVRYLLAEARARTLVAPGAVLVIGLVILYAVGPNPRSCELLAKRCWICVAVHRRRVGCSLADGDRITRDR